MRLDLAALGPAAPGLPLQPLLQLLVLVQQVAVEPAQLGVLQPQLLEALVEGQLLAALVGEVDAGARQTRPQSLLLKLVYLLEGPLQPQLQGPLLLLESFDPSLWLAVAEVGEQSHQRLVVVLLEAREGT